METEKTIVPYRTHAGTGMVYRGSAVAVVAWISPGRPDYRPQEGAMSARWRRDRRSGGVEQADETGGVSHVETWTPLSPQDSSEDSSGPYAIL